MTFRAKQPSAPRHRSTHDQEARQKLYVTVGFIAVIAAAIGILIAAVAVSYYNEHLRPVVTVDGQDVSRDAYIRRAEIELFRITEAEKRVREAEMDITRGIFAVIQEYGKDQGYTVILERSTVVFGAPAIDLTAEIIKRYDGKQK